MHNNCDAGFSAQLLDDGRLLLAGGLDHTKSYRDHASYLDSTEIFDPNTGKFKIGPKMNVHRTAAASVKLQDGRVLLVGGIIDHIADEPSGKATRSHLVATNTAEIYDPQTNSFTLTQPMFLKRAAPIAVLLKTGEVLVCGDVLSAPTEAELFNPATNSFSFAGFMTEPRTEGVATLLPNGDVLITGGRNGSDLSHVGQPCVLLNTSEIFRMKDAQQSPRR